MAYHDNEASYKALVYFTDGNKRTFYSRDFSHERSKTRNPLLGFSRLEKMIAKFGKKAKTAIIYNNSNNQAQAKYKFGLKVN